MNGEKLFVPKILLSGDKEDFYSRIGNLPCRIVGQVTFTGEINGEKFHILQNGRLALNGEIKPGAELAKLLRSDAADYLVCTNLQEWFALVYHDDLVRIGCPRAQVITPEQLKLRPPENFYDVDADVQLLAFLRTTPFRRVLDFNAHFAKGQLFTRGVLNETTEIDGIYDGELPAIKENLYSRVYKKFSDCAFRHYDAALVFENEPIDFDSVFFMLENVADVVITFAKFGAPLKRHLQLTLNNYAKIDGLMSFSGEWLLCYRRTPPKDFAIYVATHKTLPAEHVAKLPAGYRLIHAGREIAQDLGYPGDNTGDNISALNTYINENTAIVEEYVELSDWAGALPQIFHGGQRPEFCVRKNSDGGSGAADSGALRYNCAANVRQNDAGGKFSGVLRRGHCEIRAGGRAEKTRADSAGLP